MGVCSAGMRVCRELVNEPFLIPTACNRSCANLQAAQLLPATSGEGASRRVVGDPGGQMRNSVTHGLWSGRALSPAHSPCTPPGYLLDAASLLS